MSKIGAVTQKQQTLQETLRARGIQATSQRLALAHFLFHESDHPTAEDVYAWAKKNLARVSLATIYNTLNKFVAAGLIREFRFPHTDRAVYDHNLDQHFHVYDEKRGVLVDLPKRDVEIRLKTNQVAAIQDFQLLIFGSLKSIKKLKPHKGEK